MAGAMTKVRSGRMFESLKKATGLGLSPDQHYDRAFEKAVLLGGDKFRDAVDLFVAAAGKATAAGDSALTMKATANASLYRFITSGDAQSLQELERALAGLTEIEKIGTRQEMMPVAPLATEVKARLEEAKLNAAQEASDEERASGHLRASHAFKALFNTPLVTYQYQHKDKHRDSGQQRFFYHQGLGNWHLARRAVLENPETAAEHMAKAVSAFRQCQDDEWADKSQRWLEACRKRRTCWSCHREFQGGGIHFTTYSARVSPYVATVISQLNQDASAIDAKSGEIVLCTPCGSTLQREADRVAVERTAELRSELVAVLSQVTQAVNALSSRVDALERAAHRH
jgi:hypothetical protein